MSGINEPLMIKFAYVSRAAAPEDSLQVKYEWFSGGSGLNINPNIKGSKHHVCAVEGCGIEHNLIQHILKPIAGSYNNNIYMYTCKKHNKATTRFILAKWFPDYSETRFPRFRLWLEDRFSTV